METLTIDLKKKKSFEIGQQGDHNALCIHFINMKNVGTNKKYIYYTIDGIENCVPLTNDRFIVGYPLTAHSGIASAQLISKLNDNSIIKLSNVFAMHIKESKGYKDSGEYPVDPNIQSSYDLLDDLINETKDMINNYNYATLMEKLTQASSEATTSAITAKECADELKNSTDFINTLDEKVAAQDSKIENFEAYTSHITTKQNTKIAALQTRMSEFTSLKDGSTTGDAELIDARIGADGTKYPSAGDAMRGQVEQLNEVLDYLKVNEINELLKNNYVEINSNDVYVPFSLKAGDVVTISTIDGTDFSENTVYIDFYNDTNERIDFIGVRKSFGNSRTYTWNKANVTKIKCRDNTENRVFRVSTPNTDNYIDKLKKSNFESSGLNITDNTFDLNNCKPNLIYTISTNCYNAPSLGTCFTFARNANSSDTYVQFFVSIKNNLYTRYNVYGSGWTEWEEYAKANYDYSAKLSIFDKIGVIGDSFASGEIYKPDGALIGDNYKISWIQQLARRNGFTGFNFSTGGLSTRTWLTSSHGLEKLNSSDICDLYILALGINDYYGLGESYLGTENDITTKADTFYGNYAKIIEAIQAKSPSSKLIMLDIAIRNNESSATKALIKKFNDAIVAIANHYNIPVAYQTKNRYFELDIYKDSMYHGHPSIVGYSVLATQLENTISESMIANQSYFES